MAIKDEPQIYSIPENFIDESRIIKGMFKTRNFIEGLVLATGASFFAFLIPAATINTRIGILVSVCGPFFLLGNTGFNGDALSTTLKNAYEWYQSRGVMLYNNRVRALIKAPLTAMMEKELPKDKIVDMIDNFKAKQKAKAEQIQYIEGETFEFLEDSELEDIYAETFYDDMYYIDDETENEAAELDLSEENSMDNDLLLENRKDIVKEEISHIEVKEIEPDEVGLEFAQEDIVVEPIAEKNKEATLDLDDIFSDTDTFDPFKEA